MKNKINLDNHKFGIIVLGIISFIVLATIIIYMFNFRKLSSLEKKALNEKNNDIVNYLNYLDVDSKGIDKYIVFALQYSRSNNKNKLSSTEIAEFISKYFNVEISNQDVKNVGITPYMLDNNIVYESGNDLYTIVSSNQNAQTISTQEISYYKLDKMTKINRKKYKITYKKYIISNPYEVLNYYMDLNTKSSEKDIIDLSSVKNYLVGTGSLASFKKVINEEDIKNFAKYDKKISIVFVVKDGDFLIDKIK